MNNVILKQLLTEYEQTRLQNIRDLDLRKKEIYSKNPRLEEIEKELNLTSISIAKSALLKNSNSENLQEKIDKLKIERKELLKQMGKDLSCLNVQYKCSVCEDTGYVFHNSQTEMCKCLKQKLFDLEFNKANMGNLSKDTFENFNINLFSNKVDPNKYGSNISPRENIKDIHSACLNFVENFDNPDGKNLLFSGSTGLGKTYLSNAIVSKLIEKGYTVLYQTAPVMLDTLIAKMFKNDSSFSENLLNVDLLVIDDLGTENVTDARRSELFNIINTRILNGSKKKIKTLISTNKELKDLVEYYDQRIVSRLIGNFDVYRFFGEDLRFTAVREAYEETGIKLDPNEIELIDTLSGESRKNSYPNGDIVYNNTSLYLADITFSPPM